MKGKYGALIRDIFIFTISTFIPKAISFFLVPLYTNCLTTAEYGTVSLLSTTVSLMIPFLTLGINDSVLRFTIENKEDSGPFQIAFSFALKSIVIVSVLVIINFFAQFVKVDNQIALVFLLNYVSVSIYGICIAYLRAVEQTILLSFVSILITLVVVISNVVLLLGVKAGLMGYMVSEILGYAVADMVILIKIKGIKLLQGKGTPNPELKKKMIAYSVPLIAASVSWWINSSSDKYFVTAMSGVGANGVYSVAYKIPTILQMLQSVFSQAWLLSIYREYKKESGPKFVSNVYEIYYVAMSLSCAVIIVLDIPLAKFLYAKEFFAAWEYVPFLLISVVFIANAGFFESMLTLFKKTKLIAATTALGAAINIILNFILIQYIGVLGAAIATMSGYFVMWLIRIRPAIKRYPFKISWIKCASVHVLLLIESLVMIFLQNYAICCLIILIMCLINVRTIQQIMIQFRNLFMTKKGDY